ncbi:30S ribosomal protein S6--L-glutamate ligase [Schleiferiaceae bacterium]|jgi:ribosomal protein S6--L-glutamate ligase|nr:30S ribosomal protein S6--L-glutamate ligase [Bacteroidota bacterium]MCO4774561.1 30S ribosomal protein S6--L-glutamate ligase [Flavobacteriales bacterium]MDA7809496.1 30S ribosomal protein S6--L-glutamate ligase [bacterium]MDA8687027.1 30S ribosomal protein S6--L-glutamate ligase [Schleiferiaceae bacterium]MCO4790841.1 30S ribosomal protein S6--L-glutamate ligase [Flavobacteriales bacterium]
MKLAILSANPSLYSTNRLVEAAQKRGHDVDVINHNHCYVGMETNNNNVYLGDHELVDYDAIIPRIGASVTFYGSSIIRQFEVKHVYTTLSSLALVRSRDKLRATQVLAKNDIGIPKTVFAKQPRDVQNLIKTVGGPPLIVKLLEGTQGLGVVLAETKTAAKSVIEAFYGLNANILVQEFIKEAGGSDIRVIVVGGKVIAAYKRQGQEGEFRSNLHRGGEGVKVTLTSKEKKTAIAATKALGLNIAGVDMLRSERGPLVLEVNSSPGFEGVERVTGVDVADQIITFVEKQIERPIVKTKDKVGV